MKLDPQDMQNKPKDKYKGFFQSLWWGQAIFSNKAFGPPYIRGPKGPIEHLEKEIQEVKADYNNLEEYVDCFLLIIDAARRANFTDAEFMEACFNKLEKNSKRTWPDWRKVDPNKAIEHDRRCGKQYWIGAAINNCKRLEDHSGECNDGSYDPTAPANGDTEDKGMKFS